MLHQLMMYGTVTFNFTDAEITISIEYHDDYSTDSLNIICEYDSVNINSIEVSSYEFLDYNILNIYTMDNRNYEIYAEDLISVFGCLLSKVEIIGLLEKDSIDIPQSFIEFLNENGFESRAITT